MNTDAYFTLLESQLREIFTIRKHGRKVPEREKLRCEGFMHAARVLGIADADTLQQRMEQTHHEVFGISIAERQQREGDSIALNEDYHDIPTVIRKGIKIELGKEEESI